MAFIGSCIEIAGHEAELKRGRQIVVDHDVRRHLHVELPRIPSLHIDDAPLAQEDAAELLQSPVSSSAPRQSALKSSPTPPPNICAG